MKNYYSRHRVEYSQPESIGFLSLEVLQFLKKRKWDEIALAYIHSLRPSCIRVIKGECTCDAVDWRVTVYVDSTDIIEKVEQEVEVGLPNGIAHGSALCAAFKYGIDSEYVKWHLDAEGYFFDGINNKYYKQKDEQLIEYPNQKPANNRFNLDWWAFATRWVRKHFSF